MISSRQFHGFRLVLMLALLASLLLSLPQSAYAQDFIYGDVIPSGEIVENDVILFGDEVSIEGEVIGDVVAVSKKVTINGDVQGSLIILGDEIVIGGNVNGSVYTAGVNLTFSPQASVQRSVYFVGFSLATEEESAITWDLNTITFGARLAGQVGRNTTAIIGPIEIIRSLLQAVGINQAAWQGEPVDSELADWNHMTAGLLPVLWMDQGGSESLTMASELISEPGQTSQATDSTVDWLLVRLRELVALLVIGCLLIWLLPARLNMWSERVRARSVRAAGSGIVILITGFAATAIFIAVIVGIAIGLNALTLGNLAFLFVTLGLLAVGLAFFVFWLFAAYISKVIVAYLVGRLILKRFAPRLKSKFWPLLLGIFLYILVTAIPYAGWVIGLIVTLIGLGAVWLVYIDWRSGPSGEELSAIKPSEIGEASVSVEQGASDIQPDSSEPISAEESDS